MYTVHLHLHSIWGSTELGISPNVRQEASQCHTRLYDLAENADLFRSSWLPAFFSMWLSVHGSTMFCCLHGSHSSTYWNMERRYSYYLRVALDSVSCLSHAAAPPGCFYLCTGDGRSRLASNLTDRGARQKSFWKLSSLQELIFPASWQTRM